jgi:hypothetical protein
MEEHILRAFENRMMMRIFGPWSNEVIGHCTTLRNDEFSRHGENINACRILMM